MLRTEYIEQNIFILCLWLLSPKRIKLVFLKLIVNLFACIQAATLVNSLLTDFSSSRTLSFDKVKVVSSANNNVLNLITEGRLLMYKKRIGPSVEPWGTPQVTYFVFDLI